MWDYGVRGEDWSECRLVGGVVRKTLAMEVEDSGRDSDEEAMEARDGAGGEQKVVAGPAPPTKQARDCAGGEQKVVVGPAPHKSKGKNTYSMCQICHSGPHAKISNHFAQTHHLTKSQRAKYLFGNRVVATPEQMRAKTRTPIPVRQSQRTISSVFKAMAERSEAGEVVEVESSDSETPDSPSPRRSPPGVGTAPLSPPTTRRASPSAGPSPSPPRVTVTRTPPSTCVPTSQCDRPGPSSAFLGGKSTRNAPRFDPDEPFLTLLDEYLESRIGGKRDVTQHREICVDVSKYLCFADPDSCNPDHLLSRGTIRKYITWLEEGGIGLSGVISKLRRVQMAITCLGHRHEDQETETDFCVKRDKVTNLISSVLTSLSRKKRKVQVAKLDTFAHNVPELSDISDFITSRQVEQYIDAASADAQSGGEVGADTLQQCMFLIAGRLMLR